jgi:NADP-dependent 3-hydroxy acid dehydrogenase YdfG
VAEIETVLDVNLKAPLILSHALLPGMLARERGTIVNIASDLGRRPLANMTPYVAAKHGVMGFAGSLLREVKDKGIKVLTLTPGIIDTWFGDSQAGTREETWSLKPEVVADLIHTMLTQPAFVLLDEVAIHPQHQEF